MSAFAIANPVATSTVLLRRDVFEAVGGFDEQFRGPEDYDLWMRVADRGTVLKLETPLARYRHREGSLSVDDRKFLPQVIRVIEKAYGPGGVLSGRGREGKVFSVQCSEGEGGEERGKCSVFSVQGSEDGRREEIRKLETCNQPSAINNPHSTIPSLRRKAMAWQHLSACWMAAERGAVGRAAGLWVRSVVWWPGSFGPERTLPWGRLKLVVFMVRKYFGKYSVFRRECSVGGGERRGEDSIQCSEDSVQIGK
ncbi:MAG: hypothetical protein A2340_15445 [Lentisphaerae bacterium RIFOXYB12_FULL_60_10]|nr:MAG: hypothetical protein A2340_15445 [Lentisphaerae bacterium RIFOXYB12_FULL_60_10]